MISCTFYVICNIDLVHVRLDQVYYSHPETVILPELISRNLGKLSSHKADVKLFTSNF